MQKPAHFCHALSARLASAFARHHPASAKTRIQLLSPTAARDQQLPWLKRMLLHLSFADRRRLPSRLASLGDAKRKWLKKKQAIIVHSGGRAKAGGFQDPW